MARVMAFCINTEEQLTFTKGLSAGEEPDIWAKTLDNQLSLWIDLGEPTADRIKKATRIAKAVRVYSFNSKSTVWWKQNQSQFKNLSASVFQFNWEEIQKLATFAQRTMDISVTITEASAYISADQGECQVSWETLQ